MLLGYMRLLIKIVQVMQSHLFLQLKTNIEMINWYVL